MKTSIPSWFRAEAILWNALTQGFDTGYVAKVLPHRDLVRNFRLFEVPSTVSRVLWFQHLYNLARNVPGDICEFGVLWGGDLVLWDNLRSINEHGLRGVLRGLVGFDTWEGHIGSTADDGDNQFAQDGAFPVPEGYEQWLLTLLEMRAEIINTGTVLLVKGDVRETVPKWFEEQPQASVSLAYFDLDLYEPTRDVLAQVVEHMPAGGIVAFDELYNNQYPGETKAVREVLGTDARIQRWQGPSGGWCWWVKP